MRVRTCEAEKPLGIRNPGVRFRIGTGTRNERYTRLFHVVSLRLTPKLTCKGMNKGRAKRGAIPRFLRGARSLSGAGTLHLVTHHDRTILHGLELGPLELDLARETREEGAPLPDRNRCDDERELVHEIGRE